MTDEITRNPSDDKPADDQPGLPKRRPADPAPNKQLVSFILTDRQPMYHRTIEGAKAEREYLEAKTGKKLRLLKVVNCDSNDLLSGRVVVSRDGVPFEVPRE